MSAMRKRSSSIGLLAVAIAAGFMFATSARLFAGSDTNEPGGVKDLVAEYSAELDALEDEVLALRELRDAALERENPEVPVVSPAPALAVDDVAVVGPGVRVRLWDAPVLEDSEVDPNELVVHQQDIEAVINALWAGGAEAMTIQGQRITSTTAIRCVGNVLLLHGRQYSPPYVIEGVGDQARLLSAVGDSPAIQVYQQWVDRVGLGWELSRVSSIEMPAYQGTRQVTHATIEEGTREE